MQQPDFEVIGEIRSNLKRFNYWCSGHRLSKSISNTARNRYEKCFGFKSNYCSMKPDNQNILRHRIKRYPSCNEVENLGDRLLPGFHSAILYFYQAPYQFRGTKYPGGSIGWHCSHGIFFPTQVIVSSGRCIFHIAKPGKMRRPWEEPEEYLSYAIAPGQVFQFNSKLAHCINPVNDDVFHLEFLKFKPGWEKWLPGSEFLVQHSKSRELKKKDNAPDAMSF